MIDHAILTFATGLVVSVAGLWAAIGFGRMVPGTVGLTYHLARACFWVIGAITWRTLYWDVFRQVMVWSDLWLDWYLATGRTAPNLIWNLAYILAIYHALNALHLMIPEKDRKLRRWFTSPGWPPFVEGGDRIMSIIKERLTFAWWIKQLRRRR